jgi:branched-chain amino acid transport system substrate-binding protein
MLRRTRTLGVVMVMALVAAACGSDAKTGSPAATATGDSTAGTEAPPATETPADGSASSSPDTTAGAQAGGSSTPNAPGREEAIAAANATVKGDPLSGTAGSGLTRGVAADKVTIGCIFEAANYAGFEDAIKARFKSGDVQGRTLEILPCEDDAGDPANTLNIARRLVEQDKVFGIITATQGMSPAVATYLNDSEVPYIGWGFVDAFCGKRWAFGFDGCLNGLFSDPAAVPHAFVNPYLVQPMVEASGLAPADVRAAIIGSDNDAGRGGNANYSSLFVNLGATVVYAEAVVPVPGPTTDFTPFVQAALAKDPNIVLISTQFSDVGGLTAALKSAGYKGAIMNFVAYVPGLLDSLPQLAEALNGTYVLASLVPQEQQNGYITVVEDALEASGAQTGRFITFGGALGYLMADQMGSMIDAAGTELNTKTFDAAVNGGDYTYVSPGDGGPCTISFPGAHYYSASGSALVQVVDGKFVVTSPYTCYPPVEQPRS